ncbi:MAG: hypothetical protein CO108_03795 [Deltaproteobacteria bacterium CG_4_9_14_3_um_filter_63_12]|nr:MAG: hypothetical protein CO108_03795 [Deltaproteobacteria bacterium CG_4_9_14_3_um_filter_63_12]
MTMDSHSWIDAKCTIRAVGVAKDAKLGAIAFVGTSLLVQTKLTIRNAVVVEAAKLVLRFRGFGSGSPETHELVRHTFATHFEGPCELELQDFELAIPDNAPISYEGSYVKIQWSVAIAIFGPEGHFEEFEYRVWVKPRPVDFLTDNRSAPTPKHSFAMLEPIKSDIAVSLAREAKRRGRKSAAKSVVAEPQSKRQVEESVEGSDRAPKNS